MAAFRQRRASTLTLHRCASPADERRPSRGSRTTTCTSRSDLDAGRSAGWSWSRRPTGRRGRSGWPRSEALFDETVAFWRSWLGASTYTGRWREMVERSAITLKLMTYAPTGGLVAAPTAALPEQVGGERNWDYRYTWIRDASFSVHALLAPGLHRGGGAVRPVAGRPGPGAGRRRQRPAEHHVPDRRLLRPRRKSPGPLGGLPGLAAGADRQRRGRPAAARHLRRGDGQHLRRRPGRPADRRPGLAGTHRGPRLAGRPLGPARGGHLGDPRRPPGLHLRPGDVLGRLRPRHPHGHRARAARRRWSAGPPSATGSTSRSWSGLEPGTRQAFVQHYDTDVLDASLLRMPTVGLHRRPRPAVALDAGGDGRRTGHRQPGLPLRPGGLPGRPARVRRAPSRCARSPTSTRWPAPAGSTRPG